MPSDLLEPIEARDIERLVDEAVRHPDRAERIKESLKQRVLGARAPSRHSSGTDDAVDDLWDNVPV